MQKMEKMISELLTMVIIITNVLLSFTNTAYASTITLNYNTGNDIKITEEDDLFLDVSFDDTVMIDGTKINVKADRGVFPRNSYMKAEAVADNHQKETDDDSIIIAKKAFNITVYDENGNEIEPDTSKGQVTVTFEDDLIENQNIESTVYHINEDDEPEELTVVENKNEQGITVETDGFSVYIVEFKYNKKEYVLNGDSETKLDDILTAVGLSGTVDLATSSNGELFSVEEIDGEYIVKAKEAFTSEEILQVVIDGIEYQIHVTDDQGSVIINTLNTSLKSGAIKQGNDYVWNATYSVKGHTFVYRLNYSTSGEFEIAVPEFTYDDEGNVTSAEGGFQIKVPKSILKDRYNNRADSYEMSVPLLSQNVEMNVTNKYAYFIDGDELVIVNIQKLPAATVGMFDIAYTTEKPSYDYVDMKASDDFYAVATVSDSRKESNTIPVYINTGAEISSTTKKTPVLYQEWQNSWGTKPENADDYYYLLWEIETYIKGYQPTQRYNFTLEDILTTTDHTEVVGYKMGKGTFSDRNIERNCLSSYRYDYVLTRHEKAYYDAKTYYEIKNKIYATVTPVDGVDPETHASDTKIFSYSKPIFNEPIGNMAIRKYGNENWYDKFYYSWPYASYELSNLQDSSTQNQKSIKNIKYYAELEAYSYPWTIEAGADPLNPDNYGKKPVNIEFKDDILYLLNPADNKFTNENYYKNTEDIKEISPLDSDDYDFLYVTYDTIMSDAVYDDFTKKFTTTDNAHEYNKNDILNISIKSNNTWYENIANINLKTGVSEVDGNFVTALTKEKITFGTGVDGFKINCSNAHYHTLIKMYPYVNLYNTANVQSIIGTEDNSLEWVILKNVDSIKASTYTGNKIIDEARIIGNRLRRAEKSSYINKVVTSANNDTARERYLLGWSVEANESIKKSDADSSEKIPQESGVFYDLLPAGATVQRSSITVYDGDSRISSNFYDIDIIKNWRDSGQDMLIAKINKRGMNYKLYYTTIHPWTAITDRGTDVYNPVAFETGNEEITKGYKDNGGNLPASVKSYLTNLDPEYDAVIDSLPTDLAGKFIYDDAYCDINTLLSATTGLDKKVRTTETENWSYEAFVHNNDTYEYQLRYANSNNTSTKGLILYDSLENYYLTEGAKQGKSEWYGKFLKVDTSQMKEMGASPVIYYSTVKDLDLDVQPDLSDSKWSTVLPDDTSKVTAIAIDISKGIDGNDFILEKGESVSATVFMQAPEKVLNETERKYLKTYNNIYANGTIIDNDNNESGFYIHQDYTNIKFRTVGNLYFKKVNTKNTDETIQNIEFKLYGTSDYGTDVNELRLSGADGIVSFENIESGTYSLEETNSGTEWVCDHTIHTVVIDKNSNVYIDDVLTTRQKPVIFKNTPRIHKDLIFWKEKYGTHFGINGAQFKLSGISDYGTNTVQYKTSENGKVTFDDIEKGTYVLTELKAANGYYIQNKDLGTFTIDDDGLISFKANERIESEQDAAGSIIIYNIPYYDFQISKRSDYDNGPVQGAKFRLSGTSDYGTVVNKVIATGTTGLAKFLNLETGKYVLQEIDAPEGYILDTTKRVVAVPNDGNITIEGLTKNEYGNFTIVNTQKNDKEIRIYKKWVDNDDSKRTIPDFTLSAVKPEKELAVATVKEKAFYNNHTITSLTPYTGDDYSTLTIKEVQQKPNVQRIDNETTSYSIYIWTETSNSQNYVYWSDAEIMYLPPNSNNMFGYCNKVVTLDLTGFNTNKVTDMGSIFWNCEKLSSLDISNWDTSNVTNMEYMYALCEKLTTIDLTPLDTNNVTNMSYMFMQTQTTTIDLSPLDTSKVTNMKSMFHYCDKLTSLDITPLDTSNVTNMEKMFYYCSKLTTLDLNTFKTNNVTTMQCMFEGCSNLTSLNISNFDTGNVKEMSAMFKDCGKLTFIDTSHFDTSNVTSMASMFYNLGKNQSSTVTIDVSNFNTSNVTDMSKMFYMCDYVKTIDVSHFNTSKVTNMADMFHMGWYQQVRCNTIDVSNWDTSNVTNMSNMFSDLGYINLDVSNWDTSNVTNMSCMFTNIFYPVDTSHWNTSKVTDMSGMFEGNTNTPSFNLSNFDTSNVTNMSWMFHGCSRVTSFDLSKWGWDTSNVTNMNQMFAYCYGLKEANLSNLDTSKVTNIGELFYSSYNLQSVDMSNWNTSNISSMYGVFKGCSSLISVDMSDWDTSNVTRMEEMFYNCSSLEELDLSNFNTSKLTNMQYTFYNCTDLTVLNLSGWNTSNVTNMYSTFMNCESLEELDLSSFDTSKVTNMEQLFCRCEYLEIIYVSEKWNTNKVTRSSNMFKYCEELPNFDESIIDKTNANYGENGYLTYKVSVNPGMIVLDNNNVVDKLLNLFTITAFAAENESIQEYHSVTSNAFYIPNVDEETPLEKFGTYNETTKQYEWTAENNGYWSKVDDDTWVYTFHVYDTNLDWYIYEGDTKGNIGLDAIYSSDHSIENPGLIKAEDDKEFTITNTINEPEKETKSLTVRKQVVNQNHENINDSTDFIFHVEFDIPDFDNETAIFGNTVFTKESDTYKADISLKSTEEMTFTDIPINTVYTVTEEEVNNYISETPEQTGTLTTDKTLSFINILDIPDTVKHDISISKTVTGRSNDESFEIHVSINNCIDGEYSLSNGETIIVSGQSGYTTLNLHADETVTINQLPTGAVISVTETGGKNYKAEGYVDEDGIKTSGNSATTGKDLTLSYTIPEDAVNAGFVINNTIIQTQNLVIKKQAFDADGNDSLDEDTYTFSILLQGLPDGAVIPTSIGNLVADGSGIIERDIYLKNHEELHIYELPIDTQYQITEKANKMIGSYMIEDKNNQNNIIKISDFNELSGTNLSTALETVDPDEDIVITFTNREQKIDYIPSTGGFGYNYCNIFYLLALGVISNWYYKKKKKIA